MSTTPADDRSAPDPFENAAVLDARSLRGLAHPLRMRVHQLLQKAPATGKAVAERLGISSASASYHLRQLETYGFIREDPDLGTSRERWWRAEARGFRLPEHLDTEAPELTTALRHAIAAGWSERLGAAVNQWSAQPEGWREAQFMADRTLDLTLEQAEGLRAELIEVLNRHAARGGPGERTVHVQLAAFPSPEPGADPDA
ncbi:transcriptional regulator [Nocardiopsis terrae]|uniref:DNA-binding MarR family transcriptional regulator n=1 Tax=Nocardiopsis terrae TaxID=372655 RepID=A0ABR9HE42_9ACTN|nr:winged helix-turn-helix domain-containing protein [Nocardiopsis terrae]MBE1457293.1 DNA-binding MarR family transcriptional regulator [Nocardiopsis terrae]GHC91594.1 transcriptional regulator [Nocardiopsis terrae]